MKRALAIEVDAHLRRRAWTSWWAITLWLSGAVCFAAMAAFNSPTSPFSSAGCLGLGLMVVLALRGMRK